MKTSESPSAREAVGRLDTNLFGSSPKIINQIERQEKLEKIESDKKPVKPPPIKEKRGLAEPLFNKKSDYKDIIPKPDYGPDLTDPRSKFMKAKKGSEI
jgi:hypothetical protein